MSKESGVTKVVRAENVATLLPKAFPKNVSLYVHGKKWTRDEVIAFFRSHVAAIREKASLYAQYRDAVRREKALAKQANAMWFVLYDIASNEFGQQGPRKLGMKLHGKPGPKTIEAKAAGVAKRAKKKAGG
jgi:hypothetical protein